VLDTVQSMWSSTTALSYCSAAADDDDDGDDDECSIAFDSCDKCLIFRTIVNYMEPSDNYSLHSSR